MVPPHDIVVLILNLRYLARQGYFKTALTTQYETDPKYKGFNEYILSRSPSGRWGDPQDLRGAIIFLASKASDFVSGTSIVVDGGMIAK